MSARKKLTNAFKKTSKGAKNGVLKFFDEATPASVFGMVAGSLTVAATGVVGLPAAGLIFGTGLAAKFVVAKLRPYSRLNNHMVSEYRAEKAAKQERVMLGMEAAGLTLRLAQSAQTQESFKTKTPTAEEVAAAGAELKDINSKFAANRAAFEAIKPRIRDAAAGKKPKPPKAG